MSANPATVLEAQVIAHLRSLGGQAVIRDSDLAWFPGVEPAKIIAAGEKNPSLFPDDFVFHLTCGELAELKRGSPCLTATGLMAKQARVAFTTHGAGMLLLAFRDEKFALASIPVLRAFANYWKESGNGRNLKPLVNRNS